MQVDVRDDEETEDEKQVNAGIAGRGHGLEERKLRDQFGECRRVVVDQYPPCCKEPEPGERTNRAGSGRASLKRHVSPDLSVQPVHVVERFLNEPNQASATAINKNLCLDPESTSTQLIRVMIAQLPTLVTKTGQGVRESS